MEGKIMKKYFAIIALASLTLVACEKVQEFFDDSDDVTTIYAIAGANNTKTTVNGLNVLWSSGDVVAVANENDEIVEFTLQGGAGSKEASFEGTLGGKELGTYAVYPATANSAVSGTSVTVDYLDCWDYGKTELPMWGKRVSEYSFYNVGGAVLVTYSNVPTGNDKYFVLNCVSKNITGTVTVSGLPDSPSVDVSELQGPAVTIENVPGNLSSLSFVIPVPAGSGYDIMADLFDATNDEPVPGTHKEATNRTFQLNKITKFDDVDLTPVITVTSANPMYIAEAGGSQTINYAIANVDTSEKLSSATPNVGWITNVNIVDGTSVTFDVDTQSHGDNARYGIITLNYPNANPVSFYVSQEGKVYTFSGTTDNDTQGGIEWGGDFTVGNPWSCSVTKKESPADRAIYSKTSMNNNINVTKIEVTSGARTLVNTLVLTISVLNTQNGTDATGFSSTTSGSTDEDQVFSLTRTDDVWTNPWQGKFYKFSYHITRVGGGGNDAATLSFTKADFFGYNVIN